MEKLKPFIVYYEIYICEIWNEYFIDEYAGEQVSIERYNIIKPEYIKTTIMCDRKPTKELIKDYLEISTRITYNNKRFSRILTEAKYNKLINNT